MDQRLLNLESLCLNMLNEINKLKIEKNIGLQPNLENKNNIYCCKNSIKEYLKTKPLVELDIKYDKDKNIKTQKWKYKCKFLDMDDKCKYVKVNNNSQYKTLLLNKIKCIVPSDTEKTEQLIKACENYEKFHNKPKNSVSPTDLINSSAGISGWAECDLSKKKEENNANDINDVNDKFIFAMKNFNIGSKPTNSNKRSKYK